MLAKKEVGKTEQPTLKLLDSITKYIKDIVKLLLSKHFNSFQPLLDMVDKLFD